MKNTHSEDFKSKYPNIANWVQGGWIEIGRSDWGGAFIKVLDEGGLIWESKQKYPSIDEALEAAELSITKWLKENG